MPMTGSLSLSRAQALFGLSWGYRKGAVLGGSCTVTRLLEGAGCVPVNNADEIPGGFVQLELNLALFVDH